MSITGSVHGPCAMALALLLAASLPACVDTSAARAASTTASTSAVNDSIDVEFGRGTPLPAIACAGRWRALDGKGAEIARGDSLPDGTVPVVSRTSVRLGDVDCGPPPVDIVPARTVRVQINGKTYRGALRLDLVGGQPRLLNRVALEDYLLGVLPGEMPERFGLEALKAQAVAARSYALAEYAQLGRVYADTRSQVYAGRDAESALTSRAVRETRGEVLLAPNKRVVKAFYCSTCGGLTAVGRTVFDDVPAGVMTAPVTCPDCRTSPNYSWQRRISAERICLAAELPVAPLESVRLSPGTLKDRTQTVTVRAGGREATLSATTFRERLSAGRPKTEQLLSTLFIEQPRIEGDELVVAGRGWGHGVGLCQYGAAGFAARGATYAAILGRYYPGAELSRRSAADSP